MEERKLKCSRFEEAAKHLAAVRFDYQGEPVVVMEDIRAEKVIAAWPKVGQAAVQDVLTFSPEAEGEVAGSPFLPQASPRVAR